MRSECVGWSTPMNIPSIAGLSLARNAIAMWQRGWVLRSYSTGPANRKIGRNDHVLDIEQSVLGGRPPTAAGLDRGDARVLEDAPAGRFDRHREPHEILRGIELRLIAKPHRTGGLERKRRPIQHLGVEADAAGGFRLGGDLVPAGGIAGVGIGGFRFEIAGDAELADPVANLLRTASVGLGIVLRLIDAERIDQVAIDQRVLAGDLCGRAAGHLPSDPARLDHGDRQPGLRQQKGRGEPDDPGPITATSAPPDPLNVG